MESNGQYTRDNNSFMPSHCAVYTSAHSEGQSVYPMDYRQYPGYVNLQQTGMPIMPYAGQRQSFAECGMATENISYRQQLQQSEGRNFAPQYLHNGNRTSSSMNTTLMNQRKDVSASNETIGIAGVEKWVEISKRQIQNGDDSCRRRSIIRKEVESNNGNISCPNARSLQYSSSMHEQDPDRKETIFSRKNDRKTHELNSLNDEPEASVVKHDETIVEKNTENTTQSSVHGEVDLETVKSNKKEDKTESSCLDGPDVNGKQESADIATVPDQRESGTESSSDGEEPEVKKRKKGGRTSDKVKSPQNKGYTCKTCQKVTKSLRTLEKHQNLHTGKYACETCNKFCNSEKSLEQHYKIHQGYVGNHVCNVCDKAFYDKSSLNKHTLSVHMGITHHQCPYCERSFYARKTYEEHVRVHTGERPFKCKICPKTYKRISDLNHHVRLHKGETKHTCECCGEGFRRISELNRHMQKHKAAEQCEKSSRLHQCEWCYLVFNSISDINEHMKTHYDHLTNEAEKLITKQNMVDQIVNVLDNKRLTESQEAFEVENQKLKDEVRERDISLGLLDDARPTQGAVRNAFQTNYEAERQESQESTITDGFDGTALKTGSSASEIVNNDTGKTVFNVSINIPVSKQIIETAKSTEQNMLTEIKKEIGEETSENDADGANHKDVGSALSAVFDEEMLVKMKVDSEDDECFEEDFQDDIDYGSDTECEEYDTLDLKLSLNKPVKVKETRKKPKTNKQNQKVKKMKNQSTKMTQITEKKTKVKLEESSFVCEECGKIFPRKGSFLKHLNLHTGLYSCYKCSKSFASQATLAMHLNNHEGKLVKEAKCNVCEKVYYDQSSLNKHVKNVHMNLKRFACTLCDKKFSENKTLVEHMRVHTGERPFTCQDCGQAFKRVSELNFHVKKHTGEIKLRCDVCGHGCRRESELRNHMIIKHNGDKPFKCTVCERSYMSNSVLKEHMVTHTGVKDFECERCGKGFHTRAKLDKHMKIKSDCTRKTTWKNGMYECKFCFVQYTDRHELDQHVEAMHEKGEAMPKFSCKVCWKEFGRRQALKRHLKLHAGIRDYECTMCGASFTQKHHLTQHERTHTGEKPFQCHICLKSFAQNATLYSHLKHH